MVLGKGLNLASYWLPQTKCDTVVYYSLYMTLSRLSIMVATLAVVVYLGLQVRGLLKGPPLELFSPVQGLTTSTNTIEIKGRTAPTAVVEVNGSRMSAPLDGEFTHPLVLRGGVNTITVSARKRYSKKTIIERQVLILDGEKISHLQRGS